MAEKQGPEITSSGFYEKLWEDINKAVAVTVTMPEGVEVTYTPARIEREGDGETADPEAVEAGSPIPQPFGLFYIIPQDEGWLEWQVVMRDPRDGYYPVKSNIPQREAAMALRDALNKAASDFFNREKGGCCGRS